MEPKKAVYIGPNKALQGEIVTLRPHPREANYVLYTRGGSKFEFPDRASHYRILSDATSPAPEIDVTPAPERMVYQGINSELHGKTALVQPANNPSLVRAQFEDSTLDGWATRWNVMSRASFKPLDPYIEPDAWPWVLAGIGVSDMPAEPVPTDPVRKVHRLGRLFDDIPARTPVNHGPAPVAMMRVLDGEGWSAAVLVRGEDKW